MSSPTFFTPYLNILRSSCNFWHVSAQMMPNPMMVRDKQHSCLKLFILGTSMLPRRFIRWLCCLAWFYPDIMNAIKPRINTWTKISGSQWALLDKHAGKCLQSDPWTPALKAMEQRNPGVTPAATPDSSAVSVWVIGMHRVEEWAL